MTKVSVVIPNWNGKHLLKKNLPFVLKAARHKKNNIHEVIIVDDKSTDGSVKFLEEKYARKVQIVRHTQNRGFSESVNTGARTATSGLICLLNTDVIPEVNFLDSVQKIFTNDSKVFAVSLHENNFSYAKGKFINGFVEHESGGESDQIEKSFWASGGSAVFRRKIWMKLKGMDQQTYSPFYWEDIDLSYRAQKRGYKILWDSNARVAHKHESIINEKNFDLNYMNIIKERNQLLFIWKNITSPILFRKHLNGLLERTLKHPGYIKVIFQALKKLSVVRKKRAIEIKETIISDEVIFSDFD